MSEDVAKNETRPETAKCEDPSEFSFEREKSRPTVLSVLAGVYCR